MRVLGLDPSLTNYGWAVHDTAADDGPARCIARGRFQTSAKTLYVDRYVELRESLRALIREHQPECVGLESPVFGELYSEGMYGLFLYSSEALRLERMDTVLWTPGQIKAFAKELLDRPSSWGDMLKADMVEAARWDTRPNDDKLGKRMNHNEADAYLAAVLAGRFWLLQSGQITEDDLTMRERKQFLEVHTYVRGKKAGRTEYKGTLYKADHRFFLWSQE